MRITFLLILGIIIINVIIIWYEKQDIAAGWRLYLAFAGLTILSAISLPFGLMLLIPITGYNLLINTKRIRGEIER